MMVIYLMEHNAVIKKNSRLKNSDSVFVKTFAKKNSTTLPAKQYAQYA